MIYIHDNRDFKFEDTAVTIGKFDALHIGHKELIRHLTEYGKTGLKTVVLRLDLAGECFDLRSEEERRSILEEYGVDVYICYPFCTEDYAMSAEDFVERILAGRLGAKAVVVGDDFRFGAGRSGDHGLLVEMGKKLGFETEIVERLEIDGIPVSSSYIRQCLKNGETQKALKMLDKA